MEVLKGGLVHEVLVGDIYTIDMDSLIEKSEDSDYWGKCLSFWESVKDLPNRLLTQKQADWIEKIINDLDRAFY